MIVDAGFLVSVDRDERAAQEFLAAALRRGIALHTTHPVVAQVWRNGRRQARLARLLRSTDVHPFDNGPEVGALLARSQTTDVVDAQLVILALRLADSILTGNVDDLGAIVATITSNRPIVYRWP